MPVRSPAVLALLAAAVLAIGAPCGSAVAAAPGTRTAVSWQTSAPAQGSRAAASAVGGSATGRSATEAASRTTTVVSEESSRWDARSVPVMVLLIGVGALVGVIVGLLPALLVAKLLGLAAPRPRRRIRAEDLLVEPPSTPRLEAVAGSVAAAPWPGPSPEPDRPVRAPVLAHVHGAGGRGEAAEIAESRARHQALYDAEYAKQLDRLGSLREAISSDVAVPAEQRSGRPAASRPAASRRKGGRPPDPPQD
jgi:hypothetical protein